MKKTIGSIGVMMCLIMGFSASAPHFLSAQATTQTTTESITLPSGSIFELIPDHLFENPSYSWNLNQGDLFVQATRERAFRVRLIKEGVYTLKGEIKAEDGARKLLNLSIFVRKRTAEDDEIIQSSKLIVDTFPAMDDLNRIILTGDSSLIRIVPNPNNVNTLALDVDSNIDVNKDGISENDNTAKDTFFSTKSTPLYIWLTRPVQKRDIVVFVEDNKQRRQVIPIRSPGEAERENEILEKERLQNREISVRDFGGGQVGFGLNDPEVSAITDPLLLLWNFGDGNQSMLDKPVHSYARNNQYTVTVTIRNLKTGTVVKELTTLINVQTTTPATGQSSSSTSTSSVSSNSVSSQSSSEVPSSQASSEQSSSASSEDNNETDSEGGSFFKTLLTIIGITVASIIVGFLGMYLFSLIRKKLSVEDALSKIEEKLVPKNDDIQNIDSPPPLTVEAEVISSNEGDSATQVVEGQTTEDIQNDPPPKPPSEEPQITEETPSWLSQGIVQAQEEGHTQATPPPAELQGEPPVVSQETQTTQQPAQQAQVAAEQEPTVPVAPDTTQQQPAPAAQQQATQQPIAPPPDVQQQADAPSWLAGGLDQADAEGQTQASPAPAELTDTPPAQPEAPVSNESEEVPDWLKAGTDASAQQPASAPTPDTSGTTEEVNEGENSEGETEPLPDWLNANQQPTQQTQVAQQQEPTAPVAPAPQYEQPASVPDTTQQQPAPAPATQQQATQQPVAPAPNVQQQADTPGWLAGGLDQADAEGQTQASPAPAELTDTPPAQPEAPVSNESEDVPDWLKVGTDASTQQPTSTPTPDTSATTEEVNEGENSESSNDNANNQAEESNGDSDTDTQESKKDWSTMTKEEKERERKRQKRRRYRENKKKKKQQQEKQNDASEPQNNDSSAKNNNESPADEDVQFIVSADSVAENQQNADNTDAQNESEKSE